MDDNKEKNLDEVFPQQDNDELKQELEELAKTFQEQLDKTIAEAENETAEEPSQAEENEEEEEISKDMLCECCGENKRGTKMHPDSHYCPDCDRALRHYPFEFLNIIVMLVVIGFSFYACYAFAGNARLYTQALKADKAQANRMYYSAYSSYNDFLDMADSNDVKAELVFKRAVDNLNCIGGYDDMLSYASRFHDWELNLPHFRSAKQVFEDKNAFERTRDACYDIIYSNITEDMEEPSQVPYDTIIKQIDELTNKEIEPVVYSQQDIEDGLVTTTAVYSIEAKTYSKVAILYFKFYLAAICEKDYATQIGFLEEIKNEYPEMTWLYGPMLGDLYIKSGKDVTEYCNFLKNVNSEDSYADIAMATYYRVIGEYEKSVLICKEKVQENDDYSFEFYRQTALNCLALGEYENACVAAESAYEKYSYSIQVLDTMALCYAASGDEESYEGVAEIFAQSGMEISEEVQNYKNGNVTLDSILKEGDFDVA